MISDAKKQYGLPEFDLIICGKAYHTTGAVLGTDNCRSELIKVHETALYKVKSGFMLPAFLMQCFSPKEISFLCHVLKNDIFFSISLL